MQELRSEATGHCGADLKVVTIPDDGSGIEKMVWHTRANNKHLEVDAMTVAQMVGLAAESGVPAAKVQTRRRRCPKRAIQQEVGRLTCDEDEVDDLLSQGEST
jgi:hypothetical protein